MVRFIFCGICWPYASVSVFLLVKGEVRCVERNRAILGSEFDFCPLTGRGTVMTVRCSGRKPSTLLLAASVAKSSSQQPSK